MNTKKLIEAVKNERGSAFQNCNDCEYGTHNGEVIEKLNHLAELEDKIDQGTLIELPRIIHPTRHEWWVQYQESSGIFHQCVCFSKDEAKTKLKELQE